VGVAMFGAFDLAAPIEPYATLAATSEPEPPVAGDDARERGADPD
jgi:hypothetical protein